MSVSTLSSVILCFTTGFLFINSLHSHGRHAVTFGVLFGLTLLLVLGNVLLLKVKKR
jgi:hypothetical protein